MREQEIIEKQRDFRRKLNENIKERVQNSKLKEMEIKQKKEEVSKQLVERFLNEEKEYSIKKEMERKEKEMEEKRLEQERKGKMDDKLRLAREKDEASRREIEEMLKARRRKPKVVKIKTPPKKKVIKVDPNKVKFNVTEMIKNRSQRSGSILRDTDKNRVQSHIEKVDKSQFSTQRASKRPKFGYLSAIGSKDINNDIRLISDHSGSPKVEIQKKLPSLQRRLKKLVEPIENKGMLENHVRRMEKKMKEKQKDEEKKKVVKEKSAALDRLAILGNIKIGPSSTK